ncbi:MAG TPA: SpoIIE family protein phosphatase [Vicinamibacterales bacterium]|nr:SpoIIE family protein phosphatase [Vicinamibacterales bacterium]
MTGDPSDVRAEWRAMVASPLDLSEFPPASTPTIEVAGLSMCGRLQHDNTDHFLAIRLGRLQETVATSLSAGDLPPRFEEHAYAMLVADGLGGHGTGARASRLALSTLAHLAIRYGKWNVRMGGDAAADIAEQGEFFYRQIADAMSQAARADFRLAEMATSLTAVYIAGTDLFFAHVGHSRAFLFRNGVLIQLTLEHTLERLISASAALRRARLEARRPRVPDHRSPDAAGDAGAHPDAPDVSIEHVQLWSGDRVLLCTDGLTDVVQEDRISEVLASQRSPGEECRRLVDLALTNGATDSVTVLVADYRTERAPGPMEAAL